MSTAITRLASLVCLSLVLGLTGCAHQRASREPVPYGGYGGYGGHGGYGSYSDQGQHMVQYGHVRSIERLADARRDSGAGGAVVGAVVGGVIGNQMGKGDGRVATTVLGAVGGALLGSEIDKQGRGRALYRVTVRLERHGGELQFEMDRLDGLGIGDRVRIDNGRVQRY